MTTFNTRSGVVANNTVEKEPADHYLNVYFQGKQIGYLVIDKYPALVEVLQQDESNATKLLQRCEGVYRQRGATSASIEFDLSDFCVTCP